MDFGWFKQGTQRHDSIHQSKLSAVARGRQMAQFKRTELVIKTAEGEPENLGRQDIGPAESF